MCTVISSAHWVHNECETSVSSTGALLQPSKDGQTCMRANLDAVLHSGLLISESLVLYCIKLTVIASDQIHVVRVLCCIYYGEVQFAIFHTIP